VIARQFAKSITTVHNKPVYYLGIAKQKLRIFFFVCSFVLMGKRCMRQDITWDSMRHKQCHPVQVVYFPQKTNLLPRKTALWGIQNVILWNWIFWMHMVTRSLYSKNKLIKEACLTIQPMNPAVVQWIPMRQSEVLIFRPNASIPIIPSRRKPQSNFSWALSNILALTIFWPNDTSCPYWP
jgi:hypothetical protein